MRVSLQNVINYEFDLITIILGTTRRLTITINVFFYIMKSLMNTNIHVTQEASKELHYYVVNSKHIFEVHS